MLAVALTILAPCNDLLVPLSTTFVPEDGMHHPEAVICLSGNSKAPPKEACWNCPFHLPIAGGGDGDSESFDEAQSPPWALEASALDIWKSLPLTFGSLCP